MHYSLIFSQANISSAQNSNSTDKLDNSVSEVINTLSHFNLLINLNTSFLLNEFVNLKLAVKNFCISYSWLKWCIKVSHIILLITACVHASTLLKQNLLKKKIFVISLKILELLIFGHICTHINFLILLKFCKIF